MSGFHNDRPLAAAMAEADRIRAMTDLYPAAVRQMQREFNERRELYQQIAHIYEIFESPAYKQLQQELEQRQELLRRMSLASTEGIQALKENLDAVSAVLYRHREVIDPLVYYTFSEGGASPPFSLSFRKANRKLAKSYHKVCGSMESEEGGRLPALLKTLPTTEAFTSAEVIEELDLRAGVESDEEELEEREQRRKIRRELGEEARLQLAPSLAEVNPVFARIWQGALMALASDNPEKIRHFSASCRELLESLLHHLAPRHEVERWSPTSVRIVDGKPARKDQLRYICRSIPGTDELVEFADNDINEVLAAFFVYNRGVHSLDPEFTAEEIDALETRTARHLLFLLSFRGRPN